MATKPRGAEVENVVVDDRIDEGSSTLEVMTKADAGVAPCRRAPCSAPSPFGSWPDSQGLRGADASSKCRGTVEVETINNGIVVDLRINCLELVAS